MDYTVSQEKKYKQRIEELEEDLRQANNRVSEEGRCRSRLPSVEPIHSGDEARVTCVEDIKVISATLWQQGR